MPAQVPSTRATLVAAEFKKKFPSLGTTKVVRAGGFDGGRKRFKPLETWTHDVCILAHQDCGFTPTRKELLALSNAGLGKKLTFSKSVSHEEVEVFLGEKFPKLKNGGGIEVLHACGGGGGQRPLIRLPPSRLGYPVAYLRESLGQAVAYIRPLQADLDESPLTCEVEDSPSVKCLNCSLLVPMGEMRNHQKQCNGGQSSTSSALTSEDGAILVPDDEEEELQNCFICQKDIKLAEFVDHLDDCSAKERNAFKPVLENSSDDEKELRPMLDQKGTEETTHDHTEASSVQHTENNNAKGVEDQAQYAIEKAVVYIKENGVQNPIEILRVLCNNFLTGRALDAVSADEVLEGDTNFIAVNRESILETGLDEVINLTDLSKTLEVQFYGEMADDNGGPRKEFFRCILKAIRKAYFDNGLRSLLSEKYQTTGAIMGLSMIQNGPVPKFLNEEMLQEIFGANDTHEPCIQELRCGLAIVGVYQIGCQFPIFLHLLRRSEADELTIRKLTLLLKPDFSENGSNRQKRESQLYSLFVKYIREVASGRRENGKITLGSILVFVTAAEEEPLFGFDIPPSMIFIGASQATLFVPTSNTCTNALWMPIPTKDMALPTAAKLFATYGLAFGNTYFGKK